MALTTLGRESWDLEMILLDEKPLKIVRCLPVGDGPCCLPA